MQTPWGDIEVTDAHVHFFSPNFFLSLASQSQKTPDAIERILGWQFPLQPEDLADTWVQELDRQGVARAVMIASVPGDEHSLTAALKRHPQRFYGYFMLDPTAADALERVERALAAGLRGVCLFPAMHRYSVQDPRLKPIFEKIAQRPGAVAFVHCGVLTVGVRTKLGLPAPFDLRYSNPIDLHAVALQHPAVNFVVPHFGAGYFREALMLADLCPNVYLDTSSSNSWIKYQAGELDLAGVFRRTLDVLGPSRIIFGTDSSYFPRGWHAKIFERQVEAMRQISVGEADARQVLGGNLTRLLERRSTATGL
jgi:predicted TIM-barrel fold metal-dependent hydrolase